LNKLKKSVIFFTVILAPLVLAVAKEPSLEVVVNGSPQTVTVADLERRIAPNVLGVYNPAYKRSMTYEGFWLDEIFETMKAGFKDKDIVIQCADDYFTSMTSGELGHHQWLLAFQEKGGGWTPLPGHNSVVSPAPWYLVGSSSDSFKAFPWPYKVVRFKIGKLL